MWEEKEQNHFRYDLVSEASKKKEQVHRGLEAGRCWALHRSKQE
jgi:hypothetical protein